MRSAVEAVERLARARVLCVGDLMLDRFVYGEVSRISPEAPVPVLRVTDERLALGGAGNVARNLSTLGAAVTCIGVVGADEEAGLVAERLAALAGCRAVLLEDSGRRTTVKTRCIGGHQQILRLDRESTLAIDGKLLERLIREVHERVAAADVVLLSDYGKGLLAPAAIRAVIERAQTLDVPVLVDPKDPPYGRYGGASVVTPNLVELAAATGLPVTSDQEVVDAARLLISGAAVRSVLVTRSDKGMTWVPGEAAAVHLPTHAQEVFDVSGAGDTVLAVFGAALGVGLPAADAAGLANAAAGVAVAKLGTAAVSALELIDALERMRRSPLERKRVDLSGLEQKLGLWRSQGARIGFTNGCFDLLHPGHVKLLEEARRRCDRLVVGLNDDASVRRLKGDGRPIQSEDARATILTSLAVVDALVLFPEDTPLGLIESIRPDVLVKGADYRLEEVVGGDFVMRYGGRVELVELAEGHSTSALIERSEDA